MPFLVWPFRVFRDFKENLRWPWFRRNSQMFVRVTASVIVPASQARSSMLVHEAFTPTQPRTSRAMFIGRNGEIETIVQGLIEDKAHVVLYSERGRGKTSLANIVVGGLRRSGLVVARYQCDAGSTFDSFMRGLVRNLPSSLLSAPIRSDPMAGCEAALPFTSVRPEDVVALLPRLRLRSLICVIDEFDRVEDAETRTMLADTVKQLSDRGVPLLFMIIGVSNSLEQLLGQHPSIQRNVVAVALPLLPDDSIAEIIEKGAAQAGLTFPTELVSSLAAIARGWPYLAHLLGLRTAQAAARRGTPVIEHRDFASAVQRLLVETPPRIIKEFERITANGQDEPMCLALAEVVTSSQDRWGHMPVTEQFDDSVLIGGRRISRSLWVKLLDMGVLHWCSGKAGHIAFAEHGLVQYVLLKAAGSRPAPGRPANASQV